MHRARAVVLAVQTLPSGVQELVVRIGTRTEKALNYPELTGLVYQGTSVELNTTAVDLKLGTGGYHFVTAADNGGGDNRDSLAGHIMKLRYTPCQVRCLAAEEPASPYHELIKAADSLGGMPVVAAELHSMVAPVAAGVQAAMGAQARVVYIMTDAAALPLALSRTVPELKAKGLIMASITAGQAFGGDLEAVNLYSALLAAKWVLAADVALVAMGPGTVGTGTRFGCSGVEQGQIINAACALEGRPVAVLRLSAADPRCRHRGVSHHTLTALSRVALGRSTVVLPQPLEPAFRALVEQQLEEAGVTVRHQVVCASGEAGLAFLARVGISVTSMGRTPEEDPAFFLAAAAAGQAAAEMISRCGAV